MTTKSIVATARAPSPTTMATAASTITSSRPAVTAAATASRVTLRRAASPFALPRRARMTRGHFPHNNASKKFHSPRRITRSASQPLRGRRSRPRLVALNPAATARRPRIQTGRLPRMRRARAQEAATAAPPPALPRIRPQPSPTALSVVLWLRQSC